MSWETTIARRIFPRDQVFMARRKLRYALAALLAGLVAAGFFIGLALLVNNPRG